MNKIFMTPNLYKQVFEFFTYFEISAFYYKQSFLGFSDLGGHLDPWLWAAGFSVIF